MPKRRFPAERQPNTQNRQRVYAACTECRRRKRKCDGSEPCSSCAGYGYGCTYGESPEDTNGAIGSASTMITTPRDSEGSHPQSVVNKTGQGQLSPHKARSGNVLVSKEKCRFVTAHSAVALPYLVGRELEADAPPRLHSFAWNLGIRPEPKALVPTSMLKYVTWEECHRFSSVYFTAIHPMFAFLSKEDYWDQLQQKWGKLDSEPDFAAIVAGVVVLGSLFSDRSHPREDDIKKHFFTILDVDLSEPLLMVRMGTISAWILRTLYLRLTTRPHIACLASHHTMHIVEILSLHRDLSEAKSVTALEKAPRFTQEECETRRRHYWVARSVNILLSVEYGLTPAKLPYTTCAPAAHHSETFLESLISLGDCLEPSGDTNDVPSSSQNESTSFSRLADIPDDAAVLSLFKAQVCLTMLRKIFAAGARPSQADSLIAVAVLKRALEHIPEVLATRHPWWHILGVPFQTVCMCIVMDTQNYLTLLPTAMETLRIVNETLDTHMTSEALATAQQLVGMSTEKTRQKLDLKQTALGGTQPIMDIDWTALGQDYDFMDGYPLGVYFQS